MLLLLARYVRLFSMLLYGSCTARFAMLRTPRGLGELVKRGALTTAERNALLQSSMEHNACVCDRDRPRPRGGRQSFVGASRGLHPVDLTRMSPDLPVRAPLHAASSVGSAP